MRILLPVGNVSPDFDAGVQSVLAIRCVKHIRINQYNTNAEACGAECAACAVAAVTVQRDALLAALLAVLETKGAPASQEHGNAMALATIAIAKSATKISHAKTN